MHTIKEDHTQTNSLTIPSQKDIQAALCCRHTEKLQQKLSAAHVAIAGLGGLGSNIAVSLARAGVGHLHLIDFDVVDLTNLNRQQYSICHLGMKKTAAMAQILQGINPYLDIHTDCVKVTAENLPALFADSQYICEAFDRPEEKAMLVNGLLEHFPEKIVVAASGMAGFGQSNAIRTRQISSRFYLCGDLVSDSGAGLGLMAPRVMLCAAHQANLILELILSPADPPVKTDSNTARKYQTQNTQAAEKPSCGRKDFHMNREQDTWKLGEHEFTSRFILGSGKYSLELIQAAVENAGAQIVTMALRRANEGGLANILDYIPKEVTILPNTSGARNADEAVRIARLAREVCGSPFVKIEIMRDTKYLLPDNYETAKAAEILAKEGFVVMPYMYPDLTAARDMVNAGAACIMPLGAPIGSNKGLCTKEFIQILIDEIELPVIVDAGIGRPSQACEAMEMGAAAVMANTAIATAGNIPAMAEAFKKAIEAGRSAYLAGLGRVKEKGASASSPLTGYLQD